MSLRLPETRNQHVITEIRTIVGGFTVGEKSSSCRKAYARQRKNWEVLTVDRPLKSRKRGPPVVGFSDEYYIEVSLPHTNALVITWTIVDDNIHRILVDNGSLVDILHWSAFMYMNIRQDKIILTRYPLMGFTGASSTGWFY
jgi:hypothetical protein